MSHNEITKDEIIAFRGKVPEQCDFCGENTPVDNLEPEEGGCWVCHTCLARWEAEERKKP